MSDKDRLYVMGTPIDNLTMGDTLALIDDAIASNGHIHHTVVNAGKIVLMHEDAVLRESVVNADIINVDGQGVVWASKILNRPLKERVAGVDLMQELVKRAAEKNYSVFFFGAKETVIKKVVDRYTKQYGPSIIAGYRNGYFKKEEERSIAEMIAASNANILFVAISSPVKEKFLYENRDVLSKVNFTMGVGGSFDVVSGVVKRAPKWMQKPGLEWLYRVYQEPRRMFKRYLVGNIKFIKLVCQYKWGKFSKEDQALAAGQKPMA